MSSVVHFKQYVGQAFEVGRLEALKRSDFDVISGMLSRDLKMVSLLPDDQQMKIAELLHGAVGEIIARNIPALKE
jgi:hypothetical protein